MKRRDILAILILIVFIVASIILVRNIFFSSVEYVGSPPPNCERFGCSEEVHYVGDTESKEYSSCDCDYADGIKEENLICVNSDKEVLKDGYKELSCGEYDYLFEN